MAYSEGSGWLDPCSCDQDSAFRRALLEIKRYFQTEPDKQFSRCFRAPQSQSVFKLEVIRVSVPKEVPSSGVFRSIVTEEQTQTAASDINSDVKLQFSECLWWSGWCQQTSVSPPSLCFLSTETLMDSTTATAELGWTVYPVSGSSDNSVSYKLDLLHVLLLEITS